MPLRVLPNQNNPGPGPIAGRVYSVALRSDLHLISAPFNAQVVYVEEVQGYYELNTTSVLTPDTWIVVTGVAGNWIYKSLALVMPVSGGDDSLSIAAASLSCATYGITLAFHPSIYLFQTNNTPNVFSGSRWELTKDTRFRATLATLGDARDSPILAFGITSAPTTLVNLVNVGDKTIKVNSLGWVAGDYVEVFLSAASFRGAIYKVMAATPDGGGHTDLILDRVIRMPYPANSSSASFPAGSYVTKASPIVGARIYGNGATISGACNRYIESICSVDCLYFDFRLGDGSNNCASERAMSIDAPSYRSEGIRIVADGGNITVDGMSFESCEACYYRESVAHNFPNGYIFQDGTDCHLIDCEAFACSGPGAIITAAVGAPIDNIIGCDGCTIVRGSYSGNAVGIQVSRGSSRCTIDQASIIGNSTDGVEYVADGTWTLLSHTIRECTARFNASVNIQIGASNIGVRILGGAYTDGPGTGINIAAGASGVVLSDVDVSRCVSPFTIASDCDINQPICIGLTTTPNIAFISAGKVNIRGAQFTMAGAASATVNITGATSKVVLSDSKIVQINGGIGVQNAAGVTRINRGCQITGQGAGGIGVFGASGNLIIEDGVDIDGADPIDVTSFGAAGKLNFGSAVISGGGTAVIPYTILKAGDKIMIMPKTGATRLNISAITPGTGFTVSGTAADTFDWKVV